MCCTVLTVGDLPIDGNWPSSTGRRPMRAFTLAATAFVLAFPAPIAFATVAHAAPNPALETCAEILENPLFEEISLGECVSVITIENNYYNKGAGSPQAIAVKECNLLKQYDPAFYATLGSQAACIEYFKSFI
jgi:hypothetical protein